MFKSYYFAKRTYLINFIQKSLRNFNAVVTTTTPPKVNTATNTQVASPPQANTAPQVNTATNTQVATPPLKTKEELRIEGLMAQWPECLKNPPKNCPDLQFLKEHWEYLYKFHSGDNKQVYRKDLIDSINRRVNFASIGAQTTEAIAHFLMENEGFITDDLIIEKFIMIAGRHGDLTPDFYNVVIPRVKQVILRADKQGIQRIALAATGAALLGLGDNEFWEMIVTNSFNF